MDGEAAAFLVRLGVGDRIVGTAAPDFIEDFTGGERAALDAIPVLDRRQGSAEKVIEARPDLVVGISALSFGGFDGTPTVDRLRQAGAAALAACDAAAPGAVRDLRATTQFVRRLATVFAVPDGGAAVASGIENEIAAARAAAPATSLRVLAISGAPAPGQPVRTHGGRSLVNGIVTLAGGSNIAEDVMTDFATMSAEEVVARDPQAIVVISGIGPDSPEQVEAALRRSPVLAPTTAVREDRVVVVPQSILLSPSLLNTRAVTAIARELGEPPA